MAMSGHASGDAVVGVTIAMVALAGLVVLCRLGTRIWIVKSPGLDDAFITASLLFSVATTVTMCLQVRWGMAQHITTLTLQDSLSSQKAFYVSIWVYNLAMGCTKYSILLQYLRIFPQKAFRRAVFVMLVINTLYTLWTTGSAIFACWPISWFWNQVKVVYGQASGDGGKCLQRFAVWFANAALNISTDIAIGILPLPVLKQLQLPKHQRIALMVIFGLGGFKCIISILRLQSLYIISRAKDVTRENPLAAIWSSVEVNTGILCSCLPTLKAAFSRFFPNFFTSQTPPSDSSGATPSSNSRRRRRTSATLDTLKHHTDKIHRLSFDALGRGLTGRGEPTQCSTIGAYGSDGRVEMKDFGTQTSGRSAEWERRIQVVTTVEQDVEDLDPGRKFGGRKKDAERDGDAESEAGSERNFFG